MDFNSTKCCGIQEITNLSEHFTPQSAMAAFCKDQLDQGCKFHSEYRKFGKIYNNYMFTAAVYDKDCSSWSTYSSKENKALVENGLYNPYGHRFAKFIEDNKLGTVITPGARINTAYHPDHKTQVWIWDTNYEAICKWWMENKKKAKLFELESKLIDAKRWLCYYSALYSSTSSFTEPYERQVKEAQSAYDAELLRLAEGKDVEVVKADEISYVNYQVEDDEFVDDEDDDDFDNDDWFYDEDEADA